VAEKMELFVPALQAVQTKLETVEGKLEKLNNTL